MQSFMLYSMHFVDIVSFLKLTSLSRDSHLFTISCTRNQNQFTQVAATLTKQKAPLLLLSADLVYTTAGRQMLPAKSQF